VVDRWFVNFELNLTKDIYCHFHEFLEDEFKEKFKLGNQLVLFLKYGSGKRKLAKCLLECREHSKSCFKYIEPNLFKVKKIDIW
jgi:hypothetical protein